MEVKICFSENQKYLPLTTSPSCQFPGQFAKQSVKRSAKYAANTNKPGIGLADSLMFKDPFEKKAKTHKKQKQHLN